MCVRAQLREMRAAVEVQRTRAQARDRWRAQRRAVYSVCVRGGKARGAKSLAAREAPQCSARAPWRMRVRGVQIASARKQSERKEVRAVRV